MIRPATTPRMRKAGVLGGSFALLLSALSPALAQDGEDDAASAAKAAALTALSVTPLRIEVDAATSAETVQVKNGTANPMAVQIRLFAWSQKDGEDVYTPSSDLLVSPSIVSIPADQVQLVRVLRKGAATPGEKRYRLVVDQLPDPANARPGVAQTRVRFAIPVFVDRDRAAPAALAWRLTDSNLELVNKGGATARIVRIDVKSADGRSVEVEQNSLRYVFGESSIAWPIGRGCALGKVHVTAQIDGQAVDAVPVPACG